MMKKIFYILCSIIFLTADNLHSQTKDYCSIQQQNLLKFAKEKDAYNFVRTTKKIDLYCKYNFNTSLIDSLIKSSKLKVRPINGLNEYKMMEPFEIELEDIIESSKKRTPDKMDSLIKQKRQQLEALNYYNISFNFEYFITQKDKKYSIHDFDLNVLIDDLNSVNWIHFNYIKVSDQFIKIYKEGKEAIYDLNNKRILGDRFAKNIYPITKNEKLLFFLYDDRPFDLLGKYVFADDKVFVKTIQFDSENFIIQNKGQYREVVYDFNMKPISKTYDFIWSIGNLFRGEINNDDYILDNKGKEIKKLNANEDIEALPKIFGPYYIHTFNGEKKIVNDKLEIIKSLKYKDVKTVSFIDIIFCKENNNEIHLLDIDLNVLCKLKSESLRISYNEKYDYFYILNNANAYYAVDILGNEITEKFNSIKELEEKNKLKVYKEIY